jgi:outer membrane protein assembly factor BamB
MTRLYLWVILSVVTTVPVFAQNAATDEAVTYQINPAHTGAINTKDVFAPLSIKWSVNLSASVSYPLIADGMVFVLTGDSNVGAINLYALDLESGNILWGPVVVSNNFYWWAAAAYDNHTVFVVPDSVAGFSSGSMFAYSATTGDLLWSAVLPNQYLFNSPPTALNGFVYTAGAGVGGTVYAVDEETGKVHWTAEVANGNNSSPAVSSEGVYVSYVCPVVYDFAPKTGATIWNYSGGCEGGGGNTPVLYGKLLYVRDAILFDNYNGGIFDAKNGQLLGYFNSTFAPAFAGGVGLYTENSSLTAFTVATNETLWTAAPSAGDYYASAPIIVNGVVYVGTGQGNLLAYSLTTGQQILSLAMGAPIQAGDFDDYSSPQAGLSAGEGMIVVPASNLLVAVGHN